MIVARLVHWHVIIMMHLELFVSIRVVDSIMNRRKRRRKIQWLNDRKEDETLFILKAHLSLWNYLINIKKHLYKKKEFYHLFKSYSIGKKKYMSIVFFGFFFFFFCYNVMYGSIEYLFDLLVIFFVSYWKRVWSIESFWLWLLYVRYI